MLIRSAQCHLFLTPLGQHVFPSRIAGRMEGLSACLSLRPHIETLFCDLTMTSDMTGGTFEASGVPAGS